MGYKFPKSKYENSINIAETWHQYEIAAEMPSLNARTIFSQ